MRRDDFPPGWVRRAWRRIYWWPRDLRLAQIYRGSRHLVYFGGDGRGDDLLLSTALHELRTRGGRGLGVMTRWPELFQGSPDVDHVYPMRHDHVAGLRRLGRTIDELTYIHAQRPPDIDVPPHRHIVAEMCRRSSIRGEVGVRPYLWLTAEERAAASAFAGCVAVQSSRRSASLSIGNKEWSPERFQAVVDALPPHQRVVQLGLEEDPLLNGVEDLRGKTSLRASAAVLDAAAAFVGLVGFLMHLARAVDCPAVIIYGGRERPDQSGYACNENLYSAVPCAPCWRWNSCDYERLCMTTIQPADVSRALGRVLSRPRLPLAVQSVLLP